MTPQDFKEEMKRLQDYYGPNKYPDTIVLGMWRDLGGLSREIFGSQIDTFIQASVKTIKPKPPGLEDFKIALFSQLNDVRKRFIDGLKEKHANCPDCRGVGLVVFYVRGKTWMAGSSYQCKCPLGEKLYPSIAKQYEGMEKIYVSHQDLHKIQLRHSEDDSSLLDILSDTSFMSEGGLNES